MSFFTRTAALSSIVLRLSAFLFLRWIPGHHFPPVIISCACIYAWSFTRSFFNDAPFEILTDDIAVVSKEVRRDDLQVADEDVPLLDGIDGEVLTELDVKETVVLEEKGPQVFRSLLLGTPSPTSLVLSLLTAAINLALVLMTLDLVFTAPTFFKSHDLAFSRVGHVSYDSANILVREPDISRFPVSLAYRYADPPLARLSGSAFPNSIMTAWNGAGSISYPEDLNQETDFTASLSLTGLRADTKYQYELSNNQSGYFITAPGPGKFSKRHEGKFTFLHSSCVKPRVPYNPFHHPLHIPGFKKLAELLPELRAHFMLFLGDFIYIDVPRRLGSDAETYRSEYRRVYASPDWPSVSSSSDWPLPWIHVWDDHEIANDWDKNTTGVFTAAADPFQLYQISVNPPASRKGATWFEFTQGPASFFLMDTRSYRSPESKNATDDGKTMLGLEQLADLLVWIRKPVPAGVKWKFIVSSIPFTKNWRFGDTDTWGTYLFERQVILEASWKSSAEQRVGVVVLSGDRHEFAATKFPPPAGGSYAAGAAVYEFSTSPLSMFYLPLRTYKQTDDEDITIKYVPDGNSKFGSVEIQTLTDSDSSVLKYTLFVDGKESWNYSVSSPP